MLTIQDQKDQTNQNSINLQTIFERALLNQTQKNYHEAISDYSIFITKESESKQAFHNRGSAYYELGLFEEAIEDFTKALELDPHYKKVLYNRGNSFYKLKLFNKAIEDYSKALEIAPDYKDALNNRAKAFSELELFDKALIDLDQLINLEPQNANLIETYKKYQQKLSEKQIDSKKRPLEEEQNFLPEQPINQSTILNDAVKTKSPKVKIDSERSLREVKSLQDLGYALEDIDKLTRVPSSSPSIETLLELHHELIASPFKLTCKELISIVSHCGGNKNLLAFKKHYENLRKYFKHEQIIKIASYNGGSYNLEMTLNVYPQLKDFFNTTQVTKIVAKNGGSNDLKALAENYSKLSELGFDQTTINKIVKSQGTGHSKLTTMVNCYPTLKNDFTIKQLYKTITSPQGAENLQELKKCYSALKQQKGFDPIKIINILNTSYQDMKHLGFNLDQVVRIISCIKGFDSIDLIHFKSLQKLDLSNEDIVEIATQGGRKALEMYVDQSKLSQIQIPHPQKIQTLEPRIPMNNPSMTNVSMINASSFKNLDQSLGENNNHLQEEMGSPSAFKKFRVTPPTLFKPQQQSTVLPDNQPVIAKKK